MIVVDEFLPPVVFDVLRQRAHRLTFRHVPNPIDGVTYPGISIVRERWIHSAMERGICKALGRKSVDIADLFFRLTIENGPAPPHGAHNDSSHADLSAFLYVNPCPDYVDELAGTSILHHRTSDDPSVWQRDTLDYDAWSIVAMAQWSPNRCAIIEASEIHRAEPPGGWGRGAQDGRLVLIAFFS